MAVDYPAGLFPVDAGPTEKGKGQKFRSADGAYEFAAYTLANAEKDLPARYLRKNLIVPPQSLIYRRVTEQFFRDVEHPGGPDLLQPLQFLARHPLHLSGISDGARSAPLTLIVTRVSGSLRPR